MTALASLLVLFSVLVPSQQWYRPDQPIVITNKSDQQVRIVAMSFIGKPLDAAEHIEVDAGKEFDLKAMYPDIGQPGTYVALAVPPGKPNREFVGTPLLVQARIAPKFGGPVGTNSIKVSPLVYAELQTSMGSMNAMFWFDVAPITSDSFIRLAIGNYFDGTIFHRIVKDFVIQGGDPTGTGFGGPGYHVQAEFNDRQHEEGVLSMARTGDPLEGKGVYPRSDFANSAGSQFFICLTRERTQSLDRKYTGFGRVFDGLETVRKMGALPVVDQQSHRPVEPPVLEKVVIRPVTPQVNPYATTLRLNADQHMGEETPSESTAPAVPPANAAPVVADPVPAAQ